MAKRLIIMRHAESPMNNQGRDHDRILSPRGKEDAKNTGQEMINMDWAPELVLCSTANRARETLAAVKFQNPPEVQYHENLYLAGIDQIQEVAISASNTINSIMVVGHNPGWQDAVHVLTKAFCAMGTANIALLEYEGDEGDWPDTLNDIGSWKLVEQLEP